MPEFDLGFCPKREALYVALPRNPERIRRRYFTGPMHQALIDISRYVQGGWHEAMALSQFRKAMQGSGLQPYATLVADGQVHRFSTNGQTGNTSGWYVFIPGRTPAGAFGCMDRGLSLSWYSHPEAEAHRGTVETLQAQQSAIGGYAMAKHSACVGQAATADQQVGGLK